MDSKQNTFLFPTVLICQIRLLALRLHCLQLIRHFLDLKLNSRIRILEIVKIHHIIFLLLKSINAPLS